MVVTCTRLDNCRSLVTLQLPYGPPVIRRNPCCPFCRWPTSSLTLLLRLFFKQTPAAAAVCSRRHNNLNSKKKATADAATSSAASDTVPTAAAKTAPATTISTHVLGNLPRPDVGTLTKATLNSTHWHYSFTWFLFGCFFSPCQLPRTSWGESASSQRWRRVSSRRCSMSRWTHRCPNQRGRWRWPRLCPEPRKLKSWRVAFLLINPLHWKSTTTQGFGRRA